MHPRSTASRLKGNSRSLGFDGFRAGSAVGGVLRLSVRAAGGFFQRGTSLVRHGRNSLRHGPDSARHGSNLLRSGSNSVRHGVSLLRPQQTQSMPDQTRSVTDQTFSMTEKTRFMADQTQSMADQTPSAADQTHSVVPKRAETAENEPLASQRPISAPQQCRSPFHQSQSTTATTHSTWHRPLSLGTEPTRKEIPYALTLN